MKITPLMDHNYAPFSRRVAAWLLDNIVFAPFIILMFTPHRDRNTVIWLGFLFMIISCNIYEGRKGASLGRYLTRTRVVDIHTGKHLGIVRDVVRGQVHLFELIFCPWGYFRPLWNVYNLTFTDSIMSSCVIMVPKKEKGWEVIKSGEPIEVEAPEQEKELPQAA